MNYDILKYAMINVWKRKLRSSLTILSILIGVTAIYALVSFGVGLQIYVDTVAAEAGIDKLFIQARGIGAPGTDSNFVVTQDDVDFVEKINGVQEISGIYMNAIEIEKDKQKKFNFGMGFDTSKTDFFEEIMTVDIDKGRQLKKGDSRKVLLGYNYQFENKIFKNPVVVGEKLTLNGELFEVVGFYQEIGNPSDDANIYLTYEQYEELFPDKKDEYGFIIIRANKNVDPTELAAKIQEKLRKHKDQDKGKEDFFVQSYEDALATFNNVILILNGILVLIALISVIVAGVNTTNTMYTAVLERTKEIGIMKAIGARNREILTIFILEAGMLGLLGGVMGICLGFLISSAGGAIAAAGGFSFLKPAFPIWLTTACLVFSFSVGAFSGTLPALRASKLNPVDALRWE